MQHTNEKSNQVNYAALTKEIARTNNIQIAF